MEYNYIKTLEQFLSISISNSDKVFEKFKKIPGYIERGIGLEKFLYIRGKRENKVLLVAHADTVWDLNYINAKNIKQALIKKNNCISSSNSVYGLGADDRAGCAMIWLLKDLGHSILITNGEENGGLGSNFLINSNPDIAEEINSSHQFMIQLDRKNAKDFKCYSVGTDAFRKYISKITNYSEPDRSNYTDIVTLCKKICGVNLSVGYYNEHHENEFLNIDEWLNTLSICRNILSKKYLEKFTLNN